MIIKSMKSLKSVKFKRSAFIHSYRNFTSSWVQYSSSTDTYSSAGAPPLINTPSINDIILSKTQTELESISWIQPLIDKSENKGYLLKYAGIFNQNVAWGEQDTFGHVNNVIYLKWFETARVNLFRGFIKQFPNYGFETFMDPIDIGPIIRSVNLAWRYPIQYPDNITVIHRFLPLNQSDRFELQGIVISHRAKKIAARITEQVVTVDYSNGGVKVDIPEKIRFGIETRVREQEGLKD